jgi:hypothetical protein
MLCVMPLSAQVLFNSPQQEIASTIRDLFNRCRAARIVTGFATIAGVETISPDVARYPDKLWTFVVGAATYGAFEAIDSLIGAGVSVDRVFVHLGHTRQKGADPNKFVGFHPMMHSKVYLFEMPDDTSVAVVGSHNVTKFALRGLNCEAATILSGPTADLEMQKLYDHVENCRQQAVPYDASLKVGFAYWTSQYFDDSRIEAIDGARDADSHQTVIILLERPAGRLPEVGEGVYFELPSALEKRIRSTRTEVHIFFFATRPVSVLSAIANLANAVAARRGQVFQIDERNRTREMEMEWRIANRTVPTIDRLTGVFRPTQMPGMQQVSATVEGPLDASFEYLFESDIVIWQPIYDRQRIVPSQTEVAHKVPDSTVVEFGQDLMPRRRSREDHPEWYLVTGLTRIEGKDTPEMAAAMKETSPESESFVLFSVRRRKREKRQQK